MTANDDPILGKFEEIKNTIQAKFSYVDEVSQMPKTSGGSGIGQINKSPKIVFHFLEYLTGKDYIDLYEKKGIVFMDDKVSWEFIFKTEGGYFRVYDWRGYRVSIGSITSPIEGKLKENIDLFKKIIEENVDEFLSFKKTESKTILSERPLDNFMNALFSLKMLFQFSQERTKKENFGFLEELILLVSLIDTLLRYSILLTRINTRKSKKIDPDFPDLFVQTGDKYISEREIFKLAEKEVDFTNINKDDFFQRLNELYDWRNRAVHRYAITNLQYIEVKEAINKYKDLEGIILNVVGELEKEQVRLGVGFLKADELEPSTEEEKIKMVDDTIRSKINPYLFVNKTPIREAMFGEKYKGGVNPKIRKIAKKYEKELSEKFHFKKVSENKFELKRKDASLKKPKDITG